MSAKKKPKAKQKSKPISSQEAMEIFFQVWSGKTVRDVCENETKRVSFYAWCEVHNVNPPKKGEVIKKFELETKKAAKRITKKALSNESLANKIREGVYKYANHDSSWAKTGISFLEADSKGQSGTVTPEEYGKFMENLFKPYLVTCKECGAVNDARKKPKPKADKKPKSKTKSAKSNKSS